MAHPYEKSEVRRQQIADAALAVIAEDGLGRFTVRAIGERVGVTDGALFRHYRNKEEIVLAAIARLEERMSEHWSDHQDPLVRLEAFFHARATFVGEHRSVGRLLLSDHLVQAAGERGLREVRKWRRKNRDWVLRCFREIQDTHGLRPGLSPEEAVRLFQGAILTFIVDSALRMRRSVELRKQVDGTWQTLRITLMK